MTPAAVVVFAPMTDLKSAGARDALKFHALFFAAAAPLLFFTQPPLQGWLLLGLALAYNVLIPWLGAVRGHRDWVELWAFLLPLSMLQVFPDWVLAQILGVLVFPDLGLPRIGPVPVSFAFMWITLLWPVLYFSRGSVLKAALLGLALFWFAEWIARPLNFWYGRDVQMISGVAVYVLPAEMLLAAAAAALYGLTRQRSRLMRIGAAALVSLAYTGALVLAYLFVERLP